MTAGTALRLRDLTEADTARVLDITRATGVFRPEEVAVAAEVFADGVAAVPAGGERPYYLLGADLDGSLVGWICWGRTPCTEGTWDLYWLAVHPGAHRHGIASALLEEMERRLAGVARLVAIDTSGRPDYAPTRAFYAARGYATVALVPDFYAPGDDQVIFTKKL